MTRQANGESEPEGRERNQDGKGKGGRPRRDGENKTAIEV